MFVYVPPPTPPSRDAQYLGDKITELVLLVKQDKPNLSDLEIRQAMQIARQNLRAGGAPTALIVALLIGAMLLGLGVAIAFVSKSGVPGGGAWSSIAVAIAVAAIVAGLAAVVSRSR